MQHALLAVPSCVPSFRAKLQVSGFPTLKLVKPDKSIVTYSGDRSQEDLISFVEKAVAGAAGSDADSGTAYEEEL